jgi:hypothetical protein
MNEVNIKASPKSPDDFSKLLESPKSNCRFFLSIVL